MNSQQAAARRPRILVTRAAGQASALAEELQRLGAEPVLIPVIDIVPPESYRTLDSCLRMIDSFDWVVFTSANAVSAMAERAALLGLTDPLRGKKVAAIGSATAHALKAVGVQADLVPSTAVAESLADELLPFVNLPNGRPTRFLLIRAQEGRESLPDTLRRAGGEITIAPAYRTQISRRGLEALRGEFARADGPPVGVTLTSSSAATNFFALSSEAGIAPRGTFAIASIGPVTTQTLRELGHPPHVESEDASVASLAKAMMDYLEKT